MPKHTPGPWRYDEQANAYAGALVIRASDDYRVAEAAGPMTSEPNRDKANVEANARLIAAAPEMLAVIGEILDGLNDLGERGYRVAEALNPELERARALLAKIEGDK